MKTDKTRTICMCIDKGGAGKSACSIGLAYRLSQDGYSVLAIDTDPQGNFTDNLTVDVVSLMKSRQTLFDAMNPEWSIEKAIFHTEYPNLDLLASDNRLSGKVQELESLMGRFVFPYRDMIGQIRDMKKYDFVLFDTRPSVGAENSQVFVASDAVIIPTTTGSRSVNAISRVIDAIERCNNTFQNCNIRILGVVVNQTDTRTQIAKAVLPMLREDYGELMFDTIIPIDENVKKAEQINIPVQKQFAASKASIAYDNWTREVLERLG